MAGAPAAVLAILREADDPDGIQRSTFALPALDNEVGSSVRDSMEAPPWMQRLSYREVMAWLGKETDDHILKWSGLAAQLIALIIAFVADLSPRLWALVTLALAVTAAAMRRLCDRQSPAGQKVHHTRP
jgi:hypothetical protein